MIVAGLPLAKIRTFTLSKAGDVSFTVPSSHRYFLAFGSVYYNADATVATRIVTVYLDHGTPESHFAKFDVTASQNLRFALGWANAAYANYLVAGTAMLLPIPLEAGDVFRVGVSSGQAGDDWSAYVRVYDVLVGA